MSKSISFEFFPTTEQAQLDEIKSLLSWSLQVKSGFYLPKFISITQTNELLELQFSLIDFCKSIFAERLNKHKQEVQIFAHLAAGLRTENEVDDLIKQFRESDISNILALRGDIQSNLQHQNKSFAHASDLILYIKNNFPEFNFAVAGYPEKHPESISLDSDIDRLKRKADLGAQFILTQFFLDEDAWLRFLDKGETVGIKTPIIAGILGISSFQQVINFAEKCRVKLPSDFLTRLEKYKDDKEALADFSTDYLTELCKKVLATPAKGLHFFTLNRSKQVIEILSNLETGVAIG